MVNKSIWRDVNVAVMKRQTMDWLNHNRTSIMKGIAIAAVAGLLWLYFADADDRLVVDLPACDLQERPITQ